MTNDEYPTDLSVYAFPPPDAEERVVGAAMSRIRALARVRNSAQNSILHDLLTWWIPALAAAALFIVIAVGTLITRHADPVNDDATRLAMISWAERGHTPTNGELLATFASRNK